MEENITNNPHEEELRDEIKKMLNIFGNVNEEIRWIQNVKKDTFFRGVRYALENPEKAAFMLNAFESLTEEEKKI